MTRGVIFFNAGVKHGVHLAVAVASLREHYQGPVVLFTEQQGPGREHCELIAADTRMNPITVAAKPELKAGSHGVSYYSKTLLPRLSPFEETIFLDADTLVVGDISELWPDPSSGEVVLTQFADWVTTGNRIRGRISPWADVEPDRTARMLENKYPALNTGVMAWSKQSEDFCIDWERTTKNKMVFMADELAAQIIYLDHPHRILDDRFNASPVHARKGEDVLDRPDVRILHGHGGKFWTKETGRKLWLPHYLRFLADNRANLRGILPFDRFFKALPEAARSQIGEYMVQHA